MTFRVSPVWWPFLAAGSPVMIPMMLLKNRLFTGNCDRAARSNEERIGRASPLDLPALGSLEMTVLVEWEARPGFDREPGVSYVLRSDRGTILFDIGFGGVNGTICRNAEKLGFEKDRVDALVISHLHLDHMGGMQAQKARSVSVPPELGLPAGLPCYLPDEAEAPGMDAQVVDGPRVLEAGIATTGPLARALFFFGYTEEQALVARIEGKGLVVVTGCGHPTIEVILGMVRRLCDEPVHAIAGGLHFPIRKSRLQSKGVQMQMLFGTGKPPWNPINDEDLGKAIAAINAAGVRRVLLSAHDTDDHAISRMDGELDAAVEVLRAGVTYSY